MKKLSNMALTALLLVCTTYALAADNTQKKTASPSTPSASSTQQKSTSPVDAYYLKDYKAALSGLKPEAEKGNSTAQFYMGAMYYNGQGVPQDYVTAYMWLTLSKEAGNRMGTDGLKLVESKMDASQKTKGKEMVTKWKASHSSPNKE